MVLPGSKVSEVVENISVATVATLPHAVTAQPRAASRAHTNKAGLVMPPDPVIASPSASALRRAVGMTLNVLYEPTASSCRSAQSASFSDCRPAGWSTMAGRRDERALTAGTGSYDYLMGRLITYKIMA